jgi:hypothetical protein
MIASMQAPKLSKLWAGMAVKFQARVRLYWAFSAALNEVQIVELELGTQGQTGEHMFWEASPPIVSSTYPITLRTCLTMKP